MEIVAVILGFLLIALPIRFLLGVCDHHRVAEYFEERVCELLKMKWEPFGPGWWARGSRIYKVSYCDAEGSIHVAYSKTSIWGGVYLSRDRIVRTSSQHLDSPSSSENLEGRVSDEITGLDFARTEPVEEAQ